MAQIHELLPKVMDEIGSIGKDRECKFGDRYKFRGIDDALNHAGPALSKHGISVSVECEDHKWERETVTLASDKERVDSFVTVAMKITFYAPDGSSISNRLLGEGRDFGGDKATNKAMAAAFKYGIFLPLVIPVESETLDDSDADPKEGARPRQPANSNPPKQSAKFRWKCPECGKDTVIKGREQYGGGYVCWKKEDGCGATFLADDKGGPILKKNTAGNSVDYIAELNRVLAKECHCAKPEDANAIIFCVTEHEYQNVEQARATPEDAKKVLDMLKEVSKVDAYDTMLQKAYDEIDANQLI